MAKFTDDELATFEKLDAALEAVRDLSARIADESTLPAGTVNNGTLSSLVAARRAASAEVARLLAASNTILSVHGVEL